MDFQNCLWPLDLLEVHRLTIDVGFQGCMTLKQITVFPFRKFYFGDNLIIGKFLKSLVKFWPKRHKSTKIFGK